MKESFNLIDREWIPCSLLDGSTRQFSLQDLFANAHRIRDVSPDLSLEKIALYRFLLAILHRNFGPASTGEWQRLWQADKFDENVLEGYFSKWYSRFDLFDEQHPFYQKNNIKAKTQNWIRYRYYLAMYHYAGGNNATLFDHHTYEDELVFSYPEAARILITAQSFTFGNRTYKDGPAARGVNFLLLGETLFHTLLLNLIRYDAGKPMPIIGQDLPAWEQDDPFDPPRTKPLGYLDYLTWQARQILLHPEAEIDGVRLLQMDDGLQLDVAREPFTQNPMMAYSLNEKPSKGQSPYLSVKYEERKALWRSSTVLMQQTRLDKHLAPSAIDWVQECDVSIDDVCMNSIGISSYQGKVFFYQEEFFFYPAIYLKFPALIAYIEIGLTKAEKVHQKLWSAVSAFAKTLLSPHIDHDGGREPDTKDKQALMEHLFAEEQYWTWLEPAFHAFVFNVPKDPEKALQEWNETLQKCAWQALEHARQYAGSSSDALKAGARASRVLAGGLHKLYGKEKE
jgi:CRISPR system Cascade subunit CasA